MPCFKEPYLGPHRIVYANHKIIGDDRNVAIQQPHKDYANNVVKTSKYELWNFPAKNLFEQFRRVANFYFLCVVIVQFSLTNRSPVSPFSSFLPLLFVIIVTAIKQGYEDWLRHKADREVNNRDVIVIQNQEEKTVNSKDIQVGDVVKVHNGEEFPCDLVVVSSSAGESGECTIMTANLDGETNLKLRCGLQRTAKLRSASELTNLQAKIECGHPEYDMYKYNGTMLFSGSNTPHSLDASNLLLRGAKLMNTDFIYGLAVYTGKETKMMLNQQEKKSKFSTVERSMNKFLLVFLIILLIEVFICLGLKISWEKTEEGNGWYLPQHYDVDFVEVLVDLLSFLILFNYVIPISLYVSIELQKFCGAAFFNWDLELYHEPTDEPAKANTSDLIEELGQIQYLFSDKTGTLTENDMQFRQCSIAGVRYKEQNNRLFPVDNEPGRGYDCRCLTEELKGFFLALSLCHTAQATEIQPGEEVPEGFLYSTAVYNSKMYKYQASSPDEKALCEAAARYGIIFRGKSGDVMELEVSGQLESYKILHLLDFDPTRKRMSIIVETPTKEVMMICKGADSHVSPSCMAGGVQETLSHIDSYAQEGLRTLLIASRKISANAYETINQKLCEASQAISDREERLAKVFDEVERDFHILGATAVEDKLQDGVKETIELLREAGIKIWVLTGDKEETAVNISHSCSHFKPGMNFMFITEKTSKAEVDATLDEYLAKFTFELMADESEYALVVDGSTLALILSEFQEKFVELSLHCSAVLCCRMSPLQKAQVVRIIKHSEGSPITLAVGDGANDCSMIQEAHVGCGIMGKEGRQAVRCSDYAFHRFKYLKRVLLFHGHNYYLRLATVVQYFFYKNIAFITPQFLYQIYNGYSGQPLYTGLFLTTYNIFFTAMPILLYGIFEQDVCEESLMDNPALYKDIAKNAKLSWKQFAYWVFSGVWHSLVIFFGVSYLYENNNFTNTMHGYGLFSMGTIVFTLVVVITNLKMAMTSHYWIWFTHFFLWGSILLYFIVALIFCAFVWPWPGLRDTFGVDYDLDLYYIFYNLSVSWSFWLGLLVIPLISLLPDVIVSVVARHFCPSQTQTCQINDSDCMRTCRNNQVGGAGEEAISMYSLPGSFEKDNVKLIAMNNKDEVV